MELMDKQGFTQTEIGFIPEDWIYCSVGEAVENDYIEKPIDGNHGNIHPKKSDFVQSGIPFIMANNVYDNKVHIDNCNYISKNQADSLQKGFSYTGDVLLTHKGTVGNVAIVGELPCDYIMLTPQVTYYRTKEKIINSYLKGYFESTSFQKKLSMLSGGGTRAYIGIVKQRELPLVFPPTLEEQKKIATALSDVDELITNLDKLIAKKKAIKQGAMQQLLKPPHKGGKRLKGFTGDWEEKKLGEITNIKTGSRNNQDKVEDGIYPFFVRSQTIEKINSYSFDCEAILVPGEGGIGSIFHYINGKFEVHQRVYKISDFIENVVGKYIFLQMRHSFGKHAMTNSVKATVDSLRLPTFQEFIVPIPTSKEEQIAIAGILTNMEAEIEQLENKKAKYQNIKQGMMQELLTGKTRLI